MDLTAIVDYVVKRGGRLLVDTADRQFIWITSPTPSLEGQIVCLDARNTQFNDQDVTQILRGTESIERIDLSNTCVTDEAVRAIARLKGLKELSLSGTAISDAALAALSQCDGLNKLLLSDTAITDDAVKALGGKDELSTLDIRRSHITDDTLREMARFPQLACLELTGTQLAGSELNNLLYCKRLCILELADTFVTDDALKGLYGHEGFQVGGTIDLTRTRVTEAGVRALEQEFPLAFIHW